MKSLLKQAEEINCRNLNATDRNAYTGWILVCKQTGKPTDFIHCGLCREKQNLVKREGDNTDD